MQTDLTKPIDCSGCTLCCQSGQLIMLMPGDDPAKYRVRRHPIQADLMVLEQKPNGDCVYLQPGWCSIYADRPRICRTFDCRGAAIRHPGPNRHKIPVIRQGLSLMGMTK